MSFSVLFPSRDTIAEHLEQHPYISKNFSINPETIQAVAQCFDRINLTTDKIRDRVGDIVNRGKGSRFRCRRDSLACDAIPRLITAALMDLAKESSYRDSSCSSKSSLSRSSF